MFPKWAYRPEWADVTMERLQCMSHEEIYDLLKRALRYTKDVLLEGAEKNLMLRLGKYAMQIENLHHERQQKEMMGEDVEEINKSGKKIYEEVIEILIKLFIIKEAEVIKKEEETKVVEIIEEVGPDPWSSDSWSEKEKIPVPEKIGEYNPWVEKDG